MNDDQFQDKIFDNHSLFNRYESINGMRQSTGGIKPSIYITEIKLKNTLRELSNGDIQDIFNNKKMTDYNCDIQRDKLKEKIPLLHEWQLLNALNTLTDIGRIESISYIRSCKRTDKEEKH